MPDGPGTRALKRRLSAKKVPTMSNEAEILAGEFQNSLLITDQSFF